MTGQPTARWSSQDASLFGASSSGGAVSPARPLPIEQVDASLDRRVSGTAWVQEETGTDRKTVVSYTGYAEQFGLPRDRPLTDGEAPEVAHCFQAWALPPPSEAGLEVAKHKELVEG